MSAKKKAPKEKDKVIEGEVIEQKAAPERAVAVRTATPQEVAQWRPEFTKAEVDRAIVMVEEKRRFFDNVMKSGSHYAIIPGQRPTPRVDQKTGQVVKIGGVEQTDPPKPALLKPGAELLNAAMGLHPVLSDEYPPTIEERGGEMFIQFRRTCAIYRQTGPSELDRMLVGQASGECNSWETKYRYRGQAGRVCPECGAGAIIKGNPKYAPTVGDKRGGQVLPGYEKGGYLCWKKKDGCGAVFPDNHAVGQQETVREKNPDPMALVNTILKMADKRALVAATLIATGCSDLFTQDIEENAPAASAPAPASMTGDQGAEESADYEDNPPSDAATAPKPAEAPKPAATTSAERQKAGSVSDSEYAHLTGWPELAMFHRFSVSHSDDPRVPLFRKYMNDHGLGKWSELAAKWNEKCWIASDKEFGSTIAQEIATLIMPMGIRPDVRMPTNANAIT